MIYPVQFVDNGNRLRIEKRNRIKKRESTYVLSYEKIKEKETQIDSEIKEKVQIKPKEKSGDRPPA